MRFKIQDFGNRAVLQNPRQLTFLGGAILRRGGGFPTAKGENQARNLSRRRRKMPKGLLEGVRQLREREERIFRKGLRGTVPSPSFGSPLTPTTPLCVQGAPLEPRWKKSKWQKSEDKRREKAKPPNPTPTEGIGYWAAICGVGLWMDEKRLLALIFAPKARSPRKSGRQAVEGNRSGSKSMILQAARSFAKRTQLDFWAEKGEATEWPNISPLGGIKPLILG